MADRTWIWLGVGLSLAVAGVAAYVIAHEILDSPAHHFTMEFTLTDQPMPALNLTREAAAEISPDLPAVLQTAIDSGTASFQVRDGDEARVIQALHYETVHAIRYQGKVLAMRGIEP
ncbi:MAG: hypothetical protein V4510_08125 [bacterium]